MSARPSGDALVPGDFEEFFRQVRAQGGSPGYAPFPWQARLVRELAADLAQGGRGGAWPSLLDLPTGSGKTTAIEIAVFLMALSDEAPRRVVFVVDRRVVVQQAFEVAKRLADTLVSAKDADSVLGRVARRLMRFSGSAPQPGDPLIAAELRGGIEIDESWTHRPDVPTVVVSTVDQVGSRLLMQGYGVSQRMRPIHAGMLANDVLLLLDEVHLSQPFAQTLEAVGRLRGRGNTPWASDRWQVVQLSATPTAAVRERGAAFALDDADRASVLGQRLQASKLVRCVTAKAPADEAKESTALAKAMVAEALAAHRSAGATVVGVVANRVATATTVARMLREAMADADDSVVLLTGRMRPFDRQDSLDRFGDRLRSGRRRTSDDPPLFLVGTQAIEAGADFDVDVLVTECASLDALKQRFGRVDRLGEVWASGARLTSVVVAGSRIGADPDPVYGTAAAATWAWLTTDDAADFGIDALTARPGVSSPELTLAPRTAPALMSSHLDRWWQTPVVDAAPDVAGWLHGLQEPTDPDVTVVWRLGLDRCRGLGGEATAAAREMIETLPLDSAEGVSVPVSRARLWLRGALSPALFADVEGLPPVEPAGHPAAAVKGFLLWRSEGSEWTTSVSRIRPGDTVVVDVARGGVTLGTFDPSSTKPVRDVMVETAVARDVQVVRLMPELLPRGLELPEVSDDREDVSAVVRTWCLEVLRPAMREALPDEPRRGQVADLVLLDRLIEQQLLGLSEMVTVLTGEQEWYVLRYQAPSTRRRRKGVDARPEVSSATGGRVSLRQHSADARDWASAFVGGSGVDPQMGAAVVRAAFLHDAGKSDSRFQEMLRTGRPAGPEPLAKSGVSSWEFRRWERARRDAGYPRGERHEMFSVRLLDGADLGTPEVADLVRHLVASHHGHGRPFVPSPQADGLPAGQTSAADCGLDHVHSGEHACDRVDSDVAERFWTVVRRHGWFGAVWLESLLRLADHRASEFPGSTCQGGVA